MKFVPHLAPRRIFSFCRGRPFLSKWNPTPIPPLGLPAPPPSPYPPGGAPVADGALPAPEGDQLPPRPAPLPFEQLTTSPEHGMIHSVTGRWSQSSWDQSLSRKPNVSNVPSNRRRAVRIPTLPGIPETERHRSHTRPTIQMLDPSASSFFLRNLREGTGNGFSILARFGKG